jgi:hypothetical protein
VALDRAMLSYVREMRMERRRPLAWSAESAAHAAAWAPASKEDVAVALDDVEEPAAAQAPEPAAVSAAAEDGTARAEVPVAELEKVEMAVANIAPVQGETRDAVPLSAMLPLAGTVPGELRGSGLVGAPGTRAGTAPIQGLERISETMKPTVGVALPVRLSPAAPAMPPAYTEPVRLPVSSAATLQRADGPGQLPASSAETLNPADGSDAAAASAGWNDDDEAGFMRHVAEFQNALEAMTETLKEARALDGVTGDAVSGD